MEQTLNKQYSNTILVTDVTLNDFANASVIKNRAKKSALIKQMEKTEDIRPWDEKIEDFEADFDFVEEENEDGTKSVVIRKKERRRRKTEENSNGEGVDYPLDIWFLISEHVRPEDVGRFAGICKSTYAVVCSAKFWFSLYKRFYKNVAELPERLQPECMVRLYGLRACVIRSLYIMHKPLVANTMKISEERPWQDLVKRQCILVWHKKIQPQTWLYCFKLVENSHFHMCRGKEKSEKPDLLEMLDDVWANTEDHCRILMVSCPHFISIPPIMGLTLSCISLTLSQGFSYYRMQIRFGSGISCSGRPLDGSACTDVIIDPVLNYRVLDWWHPLYPHSQTTPIVLSNQE